MATSNEKFRVLGVEHAAILMDSTPTPGTVTEHDLHFVNTVNFDVQQQDIAFEGDQQTVRKYIMNGITINVTCDTVDVKAVSEAFNKSTVVGDGTNGIATGTTRVYFGDLAETSGVKVGFLAQTHADALTAQTVDIIDIVVPKVSPGSVITAPAMKKARPMLAKAHAASIPNVRPRASRPMRNVIQMMAT